MIDNDDRDPQDRTVFWEAAGNAFRPYAGWVFYGFGALLVIIGYLGIAGEPIVAKQLPYLISGGIGGILLAILGAYFLGIEELRRDSGRLDRIEKQIEELHRALLARTDAPKDLGAHRSVSSLDTVDSNGHGAEPVVVVVDSGESFHRDGCALATGKDATALTPMRAVEQGLRPCPVCEPVVPVS